MAAEANELIVDGV